MPNARDTDDIIELIREDPEMRPEFLRTIIQTARSLLLVGQNGTKPDYGSAWHYHSRGIELLDAITTSYPSMAGEVRALLLEDDVSEIAKHERVGREYARLLNAATLQSLRDSIIQRDFADPALLEIAREIGTGRDKWDIRDGLERLAVYLGRHECAPDEIEDLIRVGELHGHRLVRQAALEARSALNRSESGAEIDHPAADAHENTIDPLYSYRMDYPPAAYKALGWLPEDAVCLSLSLSERSWLAVRGPRECFSNKDAPWREDWKTRLEGEEADLIRRNFPTLGP